MQAPKAGCPTPTIAVSARTPIASGERVYAKTLKCAPISWMTQYGTTCENYSAIQSCCEKSMSDVCSYLRKIYRGANRSLDNYNKPSVP